MAYTLTQPENLERASAYDMVLEENETFEIHRICVYRDGVLIDKLPDTTVKVLDNENQSNGGVIVKSKKINISIKDLHLYDVLIMEDTRVKVFTEKEFVRRDFVKHTYITPDTYWVDGKTGKLKKNKREALYLRRVGRANENGMSIFREGTFIKTYVRDSLLNTP